METLNDAEEFVYKVCKKSFLSMWSYANPQGKDSTKELCDILVVCEPDIIIFSVKDIKLTDSGDETIDHERWRKRAVDASAKQIYGAERYLKSAAHVIRRDGTPGLPLSKDANWRFHRIAVALGSQGKVPFWSGDLGKGYVHVFDERSFSAIVQELDTISDFVNYLIAKEKLTQSDATIVVEGTEEDLLALYLHQDREFPQEVGLLVISGNLWESVNQRPEFMRRRVADRESYVWDRLIEEMCQVTPTDGIGSAPSLSDTELGVRVMARETRFARRTLSKIYIDFLRSAKAGKDSSRMAQSMTAGVAYVFLHVPHGEDRQLREAELGHRCFIARGTVPDCTTVVGISTEEWKGGEGCYSYMCYLHKPTWTEEDQAHMEATQQMSGFFTNTVVGYVREEEYPAPARRPLFGLFSATSRKQPYVSHPKIGRNELCPCGSGKKYKRCHGLAT